MFWYIEKSVMSQTVTGLLYIKNGLTAGYCRQQAASGDSAPPPSTDQSAVLQREKGPHLDQFGFADFNPQINILVLGPSLSYVAHAWQGEQRQLNLEV